MGNLSSTLRPDQGIDGLGVRPPPSYNLAKSTKQSAQKTDQLIKANHIGYGVLFNHRKFHNHLPHIVGSAYFLGATPDQLTALYDDQAKDLTEWKEDSPTVIVDDDFASFLGQKSYERGFFDYISDKFNDHKGDWRDLARKMLFDPQYDLFPGLFGGLLHPLIHLGYALELNSAYLAIEALTMCCTEYVDFSRILALPQPPPPQTTDPMEILEEIRKDSEFDGAFTEPMELTVVKVMRKFPDRLGYYAARLDASNPKEAAKKLLHMGTLLLTSTHRDNHPAFDFFLLHVLTASHETTELAVNSRGHRIIPTDRFSELFRTLWAVVVTLYVSQLRPHIDESRVTSVTLVNGSVEETWNKAVEIALTGPKRFDSHLVKATRAMLFAEQFTNDTSGLYAKAAYHFLTTHDKYAGRGQNAETLDID